MSWWELSKNTIAQTPIGAPPIPTSSDNFVSIFVWSVLAVVGALATVVVTLFNLNESKNKKAIDALQESFNKTTDYLQSEISSLQERSKICEDERKDLLDRLRVHDIQIRQIKKEVGN